MKCWIDSSMDWSQLLAMRFLKRTHKPMKKLVYLLDEFCKLQTWLVEVVYVVKWCGPPDYAPIELDSMGAH